MMVDTAIITAAGYGTRFLPATKNIPKEMLPIIDVPILHEVVKEAIDSGITKIIIVTRHGNNAAEDYFDNNKELEDYLESLGKSDRYARFSEVFDKVDYAYVRQNKNMPYGNASPILAAKPFLEEGKPFVVMYGDDLVLSKAPGVGQLIKRYEQLISEGKRVGGVLSAQALTDPSVVYRYGIMVYKDIKNRILKGIVEKPAVGQNPSMDASYGRYLLSYDIFNYLHSGRLGKNGELWSVDSITALAQEQDVYAHVIDGRWFTTGDPVNMLRATLAYSLQRPDLKNEVIEMLSEELKGIGDGKV